MTNTPRLLIGGAALVILSGCGDYLTGFAVQHDPNRPVQATSRQLFVGIQANLWGMWGGDPSRSTGIFAQQWTGAQSQYQSNIQSYQITEDNTNGAYAGLYGGGGLVDLRNLEAATLAAGDTVFFGIAQIYEAALMGTGADLFGDLVYSQALQGIPNPVLDNQLAVYDSVQSLLSLALVNIKKTGPTNVGPGDADLTYGGNVQKYTALAHTLKARFYMHTAEVRPQAYAQALTEAKLGIARNADTYVGTFFSANEQQNFWYQFEVTAGRHGYVIPNSNFVALLESRNDPRRAEYFNAAGDDLSDTRLAPDFPQPFVSYDENTMIWSESAFRTGDEATALLKLNEERAQHAQPPLILTGPALLREILTEQYIVTFQLGEEAFNNYNRTCFPNLVPTGAVPGPIPGRFYYDASERQTDTSIPAPGTGVNTLKNRDNPPNAVSDGSTAKCLGQ